MAVGLLFRHQLLLHLLEPVPVAQQLEVLPGPEEHHDHQEGADADGPEHVPVALAIDLADDRVVLDVLLDGVFERLCEHATSAICRVRVRHTASAARSFALRARGLWSTSASVGTSGRLVSTRSSGEGPACSARNVCLTMRSSSE